MPPDRLPLHVLPGHSHWGRAWETLVRLDRPLWIWGPPASGVSRVAEAMGEARGEPVLDDGDRREPEALQSWLQAHPRGLVGAHTPPPGFLGEACLTLALPALPDHPEALPGLLKAMALQEGVALPLPASLAAPACPGSLRGAHNRLLRWKLLRQLPEEAPATQALPLEEDSLATNLHVLERLLLHRALRRAYGNRVEAASRLGVSRRQLYLLIARHGDPLRAEAPVSEGPKRLLRARMKQNSSQG